MNGERLLIITPLVPPAPGGGGIYTSLLADGLIDGGWCKEVHIVTEAFPGQSALTLLREGAIRIARIFPFRAGASRVTFGSYWKYFLQNLLFFSLERYVRNNGIDVVLFHSSFFNKPGLADLGVRYCRSRGAAKWICDVRDPLLPERRFRSLRQFDSIIGCSMNVIQHLGRDDEVAAKTYFVPIPISVGEPEFEFRDSVLEEFGLKGAKFVFCSSGIVRAKGIDNAIAAMRVARRHMPGLTLVVVGKDRDWSAEHEIAQREGLLCYCGVVDHLKALALASGAVLDLNLSSVDSMPRGSLESLAVGTPILVPKGIPEFERCCPEYVVDPLDYDMIARKIFELVDGGRLPTYEISRHAVGNVAMETAKLFRSN